MTVTLIGVGIVVVALVVTVVLRWSLRERPPLTADYCRVCDVQLRSGEVWEVREHLANTPDLEDLGGGTFMAVTYCRRHAPPEAIRT